MLFGEDREDEIVVRDRQKSPAPLRAAAKSFSRQTARPDGDFCLNLLIPGALRILLRIEERHDALSLVIVQTELPDNRRKQEQRDERHDKPADAQPGEVDDAKIDG